MISCTQKLKNISLKELLDSENIDGEIYRCDIKRFFGFDISRERVEDLHKALMEIRSVIHKKY